MNEDFKKKAVSFLQDLVRIESSVIEHGLDGKEEKIQEVIGEKLAALGCEVNTFLPDNNRLKRSPYFTAGHTYKNRPNVVGILKREGQGRSMLLNGHVDTMPPGDPSLWKHPPFEAKIVGNRLYGNGAVDMKAGVSAMIMAVEWIREMGIKPGGDIIIESVVDEEGGGNGTLDCTMRGIRADAAIVLEPTELAVHYGHMGCILMEIKVKGKSTHACMREYGINAIDRIIPFYQGLKELEKKWEAHYPPGEFPSPSIVVGELHGGEAATKVPDEAILRCDIHFLPGQQKSEIKQEVSQWMQTIAEQEHTKPEIRFYQHVDPYKVDKEDAFVQTCMAVQKKVLGKTKVGVFPSGCDARFLYHVGKMPTVVMGPGSLLQAHAINEFVDLRQYLRCIDLVSRIILRWTNMDSPKKPE
jgi:acetylornithine deacetylase